MYRVRSVDAVFAMKLTLSSDQEFFLPSESFDLVFLKAKIAILCTKGFEIMDLTEYVNLLDGSRGVFR